jgi:replication-associated recombination protein RarA
MSIAAGAPLDKVGEVFVLSGVPKYTFVRPGEFTKLIASLQTPGRGMVLEGPSGVGKTTGIVRALTDLGLPYTKLEARNPKDVEIIANLPDLASKETIIIDDFHRLPSDIKARLADYMKLLAEQGDVNTKIILVGINKANQSLIAFGRDLNDRLDVLKFETNPDERVLELITLGENRLNVTLPNKDEIVDEASGSFHLAQMLCFEFCVQSGILETQPTRRRSPIHRAV